VLLTEFGNKIGRILNASLNKQHSIFMNSHNNDSPQFAGGEGIKDFESAYESNSNFDTLSELSSTFKKSQTFGKG